MMNKKKNIALLVSLSLALAVLVLMGMCFFLPSVDNMFPFASEQTVSCDDAEGEKETDIADAASESDIAVTVSGADGNGADTTDEQETTASASAQTTTSTSEASSAAVSSTSGTTSAKTTTATTAPDTRENAPYVVNPDYVSHYYIVVYAGDSQSVAVYSKDDTGAYTVLSKCFTCSTGGKNSPTRTGQYIIWRRFKWRLLVGNVYGQYSTSISSDYLFHSVPYLKQDPSTLDMNEYDKLGTPASHGCIRLCVRDARWIYENCPNGTQVNVVNASGPEGAGFPARNKDAIYNGWDPSDTNPDSPYVKTPTTTTTTSEAETTTGTTSATVTTTGEAAETSASTEPATTTTAATTTAATTATYTVDTTITTAAVPTKIPDGN